MLKINSNRLSCALLGAVFAASAVLLPQAAEAQPTSHSLASSAKVLVQGAVTSGTAAAGTFSGVLNVTHVAVQNGQLVATGLLTGTITNLDGTTSKVSQTITSPLSTATASCPILTLTLGPLHVDVLGLVINLNQVNLNIVAIPGAGNLLGNLLCDVANLLNSGGALSTIASDLNSILGILNSL